MESEECIVWSGRDLLEHITHTDRVVGEASSSQVFTQAARLQPVYSLVRQQVGTGSSELTKQQRHSTAARALVTG